MNLIHLSVAIILFLLLMTLIFKEYFNFISMRSEVEESIDAKTKSFLVARKLLSTGFPENWHKSGLQQLGLLDYIYKKPVVLTETSGIDRGYILVNLTDFVLDENCSLTALNSTLRIYEEAEVPFALYNQTFCEGTYLKSATIVLNSSFSTNQSKLFFIYFSNDSSVLRPNYSLPFSTASNFNLKVYPTEKTLYLSVDKLKALRQLDYTDVVASLLAGNEMYLEVTE